MSVIQVYTILLFVVRCLWCARARVCVIHWHCSARLSMFNMEKRYRNKIIIIIIITQMHSQGHRFPRAHLLPYLAEVFAQLQDLLVLNAPAGCSANGVPHLLSEDDQLFIYETASTLIISSTLQPEVGAVSSLC